MMKQKAWLKAPVWFAACFMAMAAMSGIVLADDAPAPDLSKPAMEFMLVRSKAACEPLCSTWISAEGRIDATSPGKLRTIIASLKGQRLPLVLSSGGGDVKAAIAMGLMIRAAGMPVFIGRSQLSGCSFTEPHCAGHERAGHERAGHERAGAMALGSITSYKALCYSACPMVLAGGVARIVGERALVGVHQITIGRAVTQSNRDETAHEQTGVAGGVAAMTYSTDLTPALRAAIDDYWKRMGIDPSVTDIMLTASPRGIRRIAQADLLRLGLKTGEGMAEDLAADGACQTKLVPVACVDAETGSAR
jgi:hypothetical protein